MAADALAFSVAKPPPAMALAMYDIGTISSTCAWSSCDVTVMPPPARYWLSEVDRFWWTAGCLFNSLRNIASHYGDVIMGAVASQITSLTIVYSTVYSGPDQRKYQSSASLAFVQGILRWPVNSSHKWPVTRKMFPFDDAIMWRWYQYNTEKFHQFDKVCIYGIENH